MNRLTISLLMTLATFQVQAQGEAAPDSTAEESLPVLALKTNLLADIALGLNVEAELPLDSLHRWTLMGEYWGPWYVWHHNARAYELQVAGLELRRWLSARCQHDALSGWFAGIYAGVGRYDLEWNSEVLDQSQFR